MTELSPFQVKVLGCFKTANVDVPLYIIYGEVYSRAERRGLKTREMQQKLAPIFRLINAKLDIGVIEPGLLKQTYRLSLKKA